MIDWLRHTLHLVPDTAERERTDALVQRIEEAVASKQREDAALSEELRRHHPQTDRARALLRARDGGGTA